MRDITPDMFRAWVERADDEDLEEFIEDVMGIIEGLESDDFFGTEGFEKRFA